MKKQNGIRNKLTGIMTTITAITIVLTFAATMICTGLLEKKAESVVLEQAIQSAQIFTEGQTNAIEQQIIGVLSKIEQTAKYTEHIYENPQQYGDTHSKALWEFSPDTTGVTFHWDGFSEADTKDPAVIKEADRLAPLEEEFEALVETCPMVVSIYAATESHINIGYDENALAKVGANYNPEKVGAEWYLVPMQTGKDYISNAYSDVFNRGLMITVSVPYYVDGKVHGVIGADINIQNINENILDLDMGNNSGYAMLFDRNGDPISAKDMKEGVTGEDLLGTGAAKIIEMIKGEGYGVCESTINGDKSYVIFDYFDVTNWSLVIVLSVDAILAPVIAVRNNIIIINIISLIIFALLFFGIRFYVRKTADKFARPIIELTDHVGKIGDGNLDYKSTIETGDEIETLSKSFEQMTISLKEYIENLTTVTKEKERIGAELDVATQIQASMLPCIFPAFPDRLEFDIFATMDPAKEVGGDFYDFFMIDESHLAIVVADVSGKGVPAALFMVIGKTLIKDHTQPDRNLGEVFMMVNNLLCESNSEGLFITAFEGVLDLKTGEFRYVNAGHELPFIKKKNGDYVAHEMESAFVLAGLENMPYKEASIMLEPGDMLFQYTDGVPEATNAQDELYDMSRLEKVLNANKDKKPNELLPAVKADIDLFVKEAPQFDDITMLCLEFKQKMI